jgi:hypothetical protein
VINQESKEVDLSGIFLIRRKGFLLVELIQVHEVGRQLTPTGMRGIPTRGQWFRKSIWHFLMDIPWFGAGWARKKYGEVKITYIQPSSFKPSWQHQFGAVQDD